MPDAIWVVASVIGVAAWAAIIITWIITRNRRRPAEEQDSALSTVLTRLDAIDTRLAAVEKTLNDIP